MSVNTKESMVFNDIFVVSFLYIILLIGYIAFHLLQMRTEPAERSSEMSEDLAGKNGTATVQQIDPQAETGKKKSTCRDAVVAAAKIVTRDKNVNEFTAQEIIDCLLTDGTRYSANTIRHHVIYRCCTNSINDLNSHRDFERVGRGRYRLAGG